MTLEKRRLGRTGLEVTALGFGAWEIGWTDVNDGDDVAFGDGLEGLKRAQRAGKIRFTCLSADGEVAKRAIDIGEFDTLQLTYNALEQGPGELIEAAGAKDMGVIVKNPIANGAYLLEKAPDGEQGQWWERARSVLDPVIIGQTPKTEATLRWLLADERVHTGIVGTTSVLHLQDNVAAARRGPLTAEVVAQMNRRYTEVSAEA